jgi:8-oxo-dGTP diphosphatase
MEANGEQVCELMDDVKAVEWLPLDAAVERLSRACERVFLANVGPLALEAAAPARFAQQPEARQPVLDKDQGGLPAAIQPSLATPTSAPPRPDSTFPATAQDERPFVVSAVVETPVRATTERESRNNDTVRTAQGRRRNLVQKVRDWLRRAA